MGSITSKNRQIKAAPDNEQEIISAMLPIYYRDDTIFPFELEMAISSWNAIIHNLSPKFLTMKEDPGFPYLSCVTYFYDTFYMRLFHIYPLSKPLFKNGIKSQGKSLVQMISFALNEAGNKQKFEKKFIKLTEIHNQLGVKAIEYGMVGEVLFWSLKYCLGPDLYNDDTHKAWEKIYSKILSIMVPAAVQYELRTIGSSQSKRFQDIYQYGEIKNSAETYQDLLKFHAKEYSNSDNNNMTIEEQLSYEIASSFGHSMPKSVQDLD